MGLPNMIPRSTLKQAQSRIPRCQNGRGITIYPFPGLSLIQIRSVS